MWHMCPITAAHYSGESIVAEQVLRDAPAFDG